MSGREGTSYGYPMYQGSSGVIFHSMNGMTHYDKHYYGKLDATRYNSARVYNNGPLAISYGSNNIDYVVSIDTRTGRAIHGSEMEIRNRLCPATKVCENCFAHIYNYNCPHNVISFTPGHRGTCMHCGYSNEN